MLDDCLLRGGIPSPEFAMGIATTLRYGAYIESPAEMLKKYPCANDYWKKEKRPDFSKIHIPVYMVGSWDSNVHPYGTYRAFNMITSEDKWLRIHNTQEWYDQQQDYYRNDLRKFFDYFLKGIANDWPDTPAVRLTLLDPTGTDIVNKPAKHFPVPDTDYKTLYLNASDFTLGEQLPDTNADCTYLAEEGHGELVKFRLKAAKEMLLCGYFTMKLYVSTTEGDDMDLFAYVHKEDSIGAEHFHPMLNCRYQGAEARLRVSCRKIRNDVIYDFSHDCSNPQKILPGQIVEIRTVFWPMGLVIHEGEYLVFTISSRALRESEIMAPPPTTINKGSHRIYTGPEYPSSLEIPLI